MDEIITALRELVDKYQSNKLTGVVAVRISFFKGGIANFKKIDEENKEIKKINKTDKTIDK